MSDKLEIKILQDFSNFKKDQTFELEGDLIVLTGENGIGKTKLFSEMGIEQLQEEAKVVIPGESQGTIFYIDNKSFEKMTKNEDNRIKFEVDEMWKVEGSEKEKIILDGDKSYGLGLTDLQIYLPSKITVFASRKPELNDKIFGAWYMNYRYDQKRNLYFLSVVYDWKYDKSKEEWECKIVGYINDQQNIVSYSANKISKKLPDFIQRELNDKNNLNKTIKEIQGCIDLKLLKSKDITYRIKEEKSNLWKEINTSNTTNISKENYKYPIFDKINEELKKYNLSIEEKEAVHAAQAINMNYELYFLTKNLSTSNENKLSYNELSSGQKLYVNLVNLKMELEEYNKGIKYLVLDEIDYPINYRNFENFYDVLKNTFIANDIKVIILTHNLGLIHYLANKKEEDKGILFYEMEKDNKEDKVDINKKTDILSLEDLKSFYDNDKKVKELISKVKNSGKSKIILVEGKTDERYLEWYLKGPNIYNYEIKNCEGTDQLIKIYEKLIQIDFLKHNIFVFIDGDHKGAVGKFKQINNTYIIPDGKCIEEFIKDNIKEKSSLLFGSAGIIRTNFNENHGVISWEIDNCTIQHNYNPKGDNKRVFDTKKDVWCFSPNKENHECAKNIIESKENIRDQIMKNYKRPEDVFDEKIIKGFENILKFIKKK